MSQERGGREEGEKERVGERARREEGTWEGTWEGWRDKIRKNGLISGYTGPCSVNGCVSCAWLRASPRSLISFAHSYPSLWGQGCAVGPWAGRLRQPVSPPSRDATPKGISRWPFLEAVCTVMPPHEPHPVGRAIIKAFSNNQVHLSRKPDRP